MRTPVPVAGRLPASGVPRTTRLASLFRRRRLVPAELTAKTESFWAAAAAGSAARTAATRSVVRVGRLMESEAREGSARRQGGWQT